jgi:MFS family permease
VASSGGGFVVVPLLSIAIQAFGWRHGLLYEAIVLTFVIIGLAFFVLRNGPEDMGLGEHPELQGQSRARGRVERLRWREFLASGAFWIPSLTLAGISGTAQATVITLVPYGIQLGFAPASAALLISVFSLFAAITKIVAGILADRVNQRILLVLAALFMTLSWLSLSLSSTYGAIFAGACLAGIALGCALPTTAGLIAMRFGPERFGSVMGWTYAFTCICAIASVLFAGSVFDRTHGYVLAFEVFLILMGSLAVATLVFARSARGVRI